MEKGEKKRLSYVSRQRHSPYIYDTVISIMWESAEKYPDKEILVKHDVDGNRETMTYRKLKADTTKLAKFLASKGIKRGDRVAIFGPNTLEWVVGELAIIAAGGMAVHIATSATDATDILDIFTQAECKAFIIEPGTDGRFAEPIRQLTAHFIKGNPPQKQENQSDPTFVFLRDMEGMQSYPSLSKVLDLDSLEIDLPILYPEDEIVVFTTSGTTGNPKMVAHSHFEL